VSDRRLVVLRHAKAEHPQQTGDAERPLTARGHDDAGAAGAWLINHQLVPDVVLCSPARRARDTWYGVKTALGDAAAKVTVVYEPLLYAAEADELVDLIADTEPDARVLLLVGHNPTLSQLSALFDRAGGPPAGLRTSGLAVHQVTGDWSTCTPGQAPLTATHTARA